jgi:hypothetical protein
MADEGSTPGASGPERDLPGNPLALPEERFPSEIEELLAQRHGDANAPARRHSWEDVSRPLGRVRRSGRIRRLDANVVALAVLSMIGCALLVFVLMSGGGDQVPPGQYVAFVATSTPEPTQLSVIQATATPTAQPTSVAHAQPTKTASARPTPTSAPLPTATPFPTATPRPTATPVPPTPVPPTPTPRPTATPQPTPTPTQPPAPQIDVSPNPVTEAPCSGSPFPVPLTVSNSGGGTLAWDITPSALPAGVLAVPASGSLNGGQSQQVNLSGSTASGSFTVEFTSNGGNLSVTVICS